VENILFLAHTETDGTLAKPALEALAAAVSLGGELTVGLVGLAAGAAADRIAGCGARRFLAVEGEPFAQPRYSTDAAAAEAIARAAAPGLVLAAHTSRWARAMAGVAARLNGRIDTHATRIAEANGVPAVTRWFYRQRMEAVLTRSQRPWFVLLESGCCAAWSGHSGGQAGGAAVERVPAEAASRTTVTGTRAPQSGEQTIRPDADLLFVAGAGWTKKQADGAPHPEKAEQLILGFLRASQASLGGSKSLVDLSGEGQAVLTCMSHLNQIGQTGSTPRHPKGLSTCCHGEEPHVVGWRFITERRAINLDPNCGWARGKADVLYVADAFAVMEHVNRLLGEGAR
jgi:electron transfer flavoprotein alpha subunit